MIDSHCHFDFAPFLHSPIAYLQAANKAGVHQIIMPAVGQENWQSLILLAKQYPKTLYYALGIHPLWADKHADTDELNALLASKQTQCVAIGECGLDFFNQRVNKNHQIALLFAQFELAIKYDLPVILHCRKAHNEMLAIVNKFPKLRGVLHAFSGSEQQGWEYIKRGFYLGIGGTITYERANKTRQAVASLPLSSLLLETDAPDMPIFGLQAKPNLPQYLPLIAKALAVLKNTSVAEIERQTLINTATLFHL